uniref:FimV/HubP-related protein n=1 Tax=Roseateles sp. TaxID=1971397 RepID=UPI0040365405
MTLLLGVAPQQAQALGLGQPLIHSTLGRPLDASIPLTLAEGERLSDSCLRAEVSAGDARVPAGLLQLRIEGEPGQQRVRLQSQVGIEEPALRITLALGCPLRLTREFNAFVDPPASAAAAPLPLVVPPAPPALVEPVARLRAEVPPAPAAVVRQRPRPKPRASGPRLLLERPEVLVAQAPRPVQPAASAPEMELTPELEAQIVQLEQTVAQLRAELLARQQAEAQAAAAAIPAARPAASVTVPAPIQSARAAPYRDPMTWMLTLALSLLAGSAAFYFSRWRDQRARRELAYWRALHAAEGAGLPLAAPSPGIAPPVVGVAAALPDEGQHQITRPQPRPMPWAPAPSAPATAAPVPRMQATQPLPVQAAAAPVLSSELTIADELLDLQQQVEFLQLLGQQDAAADLLATRLTRGHAGAMPYLLLMELCQQRGEPEVFAELVKQFEQRFGASAPQWSQSLSRGRSLDASASVVAHLQTVWADPAAAMKMLQELLAQGGGPGAVRFDLPAYRDLLMLYSIARDLFEAGLRGDEVDLMLPIDSSFGSDAR